MNSITVNGISVCPAGEERYVYFRLLPRNHKKHCQYDYRHIDGELFSTVAPTLEQCREKRDKWLEKKAPQSEPAIHTDQSKCVHYTPANYSVCSTCNLGGYCNRVCDKFTKR